MYLVLMHQLHEVSVRYFGSVPIRRNPNPNPKPNPNFGESGFGESGRHRYFTGTLASFTHRTATLDAIEDATGGCRPVSFDTVRCRPAT